MVIWLNGISTLIGYLIRNLFHVNDWKVNSLLENIFVYQGIIRTRKKLLILLHRHLLSKQSCFFRSIFIFFGHIKFLIFLCVVWFKGNSLLQTAETTTKSNCIIYKRTNWLNWMMHYRKGEKKKKKISKSTSNFVFITLCIIILKYDSAGIYPPPLPWSSSYWWSLEYTNCTHCRRARPMLKGGVLDITLNQIW